MDGDCQRPACCISTTEAPAAASDCAAPIRRLWPEIRLVIPAIAARAVMMQRTERAERRPRTRPPPLVMRRKSGPSAASPAASRSDTSSAATSLVHSRASNEGDDYAGFDSSLTSWPL